MTALSIKERSVTAVQWELRRPRLPGGKASLHHHWEILGCINILINMRESITGEQGLSRSWWWGSRANGLDQCAAESHTWIPIRPSPPAPSSPTDRPTTPSSSVVSNLQITCFTEAFLIHFLDGDRESRVEENHQSQVLLQDRQARLSGLSTWSRVLPHPYPSGQFNPACLSEKCGGWGGLLGPLTQAWYSLT